MRLEYTIPPMQVMFFQAAPFAESEQFDVTVPGGMYISETLRTTGAVSPGAMCSAMIRVCDLEQVRTWLSPYTSL